LPAFELHCHTTRYSECSVMSPSALVRQARKIGLDGVCITEHDVAWSDDELAELRREADVGPLTVLSAQEARTHTDSGELEGDFLVDFPVEGPVDAAHAPVAELLDNLVAAGEETAGR